MEISPSPINYLLFTLRGNNNMTDFMYLITFFRFPLDKGHVLKNLWHFHAFLFMIPTSLLHYGLIIVFTSVKVNSSIIYQPSREN